MAVIIGGMVAAFVVLLAKLPEAFSFTDALTVAGGFHKLETVDFTISLERRYTFWSGLLGGFFLALSYFGTDQSQVQRYLSGASLRESRLGLMFNAVCKIPMQFFILLLGAMVFVFYQFVVPPLFFNETVWQAELRGKAGEELRSLEREFAANHSEKHQSIVRWLDAKHAGDAAAEAQCAPRPWRRTSGATPSAPSARKALPKATANDTDYVFMTFVLQQLPHGLIGLLDRGHLRGRAPVQSRGAERAGVDNRRRFLSPYRPPRRKR